jgi:hypothetical protein
LLGRSVRYLQRLYERFEGENCRLNNVNLSCCKEGRGVKPAEPLLRETLSNFFRRGKATASSIGADRGYHNARIYKLLHPRKVKTIGLEKLEFRGGMGD